MTNTGGLYNCNFVLLNNGRFQTGRVLIPPPSVSWDLLCCCCCCLPFPSQNNKTHPRSYHDHLYHLKRTVQIFSIAMQVLASLCKSYISITKSLIIFQDLIATSILSLKREINPLKYHLSLNKLKQVFASLSISLRNQRLSPKILPYL